MFVTTEFNCTLFLICICNFTINFNSSPETVKFQVTGDAPAPARCVGEPFVVVIVVWPGPVQGQVKLDWLKKIEFLEV